MLKLRGLRRSADASLRTLLCALLMTVPVAESAYVQASDELAEARQRYADAVVAIDRGQWTEYRSLRESLDNYPLALYLDFFQLQREIARVEPPEALGFVESSQDSPVANRFLAAYLDRAGRQRRWEDFLRVMTQPPRDIELQCFYYRAKLAVGEVDAAWQGAKKLWVHGESRPKVCDPLFAAWMDAGGATDDVVWARLLATFESRKFSLMRYVARQGSENLTPWSDALVAVYRNPDRLARLAPQTVDPRRADIIVHGVRRLARYSPEKALPLWLELSQTQEFSAEQRREAEWRIAFHTLLEDVRGNLAWVDEHLARWGDDKLVEMRIRLALEAGDWPGVVAATDKLSEAKRGAPDWLYWRGRALTLLGQPEAGRQLLSRAAGERSYYGFLAADSLGAGYSFNHQPPALSAQPVPVFDLPGLSRVRELNHQQEPLLAHSEWQYVLRRVDNQGRTQLAALAADEGWYRLAIDAANRASAWDALDLRFPLAYTDVFQAEAASFQVPPTELMAIARRESAFFPAARSPVGARGLMQVMPATGRAVARKIGLPRQQLSLEAIDQNVRLGGAYYRQLLDEFNDNRVLALAAYNAGPNRVAHWRNEGEEGLPADIWIETLPFRETRDYVKAVLSYNVVFNYLQSRDQSLFTAKEWQTRY